MNTGFFYRLPWVSLGMLWFSYGMLGWYLAAHHVAWLVGIGAIVLMLMLTGTGGAFLRQVAWFTSQSLFITISVCLCVSIAAFLFRHRLSVFGSDLFTRSNHVSS
ncbi:MAG: hypothetical protein HC780_21830 [Leptolyngbyaceae cyanobacterium CSU_1_3]|nr:hypothetical protein [Leptolyngbyaceae cyanobacterium CSU_1_3]